MAMERVSISKVVQNPGAGTVLVDSGQLATGVWNFYFLGSSGAGTSTTNQLSVRLLAADGAVLLDQRAWHLRDSLISVPLQLRVNFGERVQMRQEAGGFNGFVSASVVGLRVETLS